VFKQHGPLPKEFIISPYYQPEQNPNKTTSCLSTQDPTKAEQRALLKPALLPYAPPSYQNSDHRTNVRTDRKRPRRHHQDRWRPRWHSRPRRRRDHQQHHRHQSSRRWSPGHHWRHRGWRQLCWQGCRERWSGKEELVKWLGSHRGLMLDLLRKPPWDERLSV
jgi:hypothetical protein